MWVRDSDLRRNDGTGLSKLVGSLAGDGGDGSRVSAQRDGRSFVALAGGRHRPSYAVVKGFNPVLCGELV